MDQTLAPAMSLSPGTEPSMNSAEGLVKRPFGVYEVSPWGDFGTWTAVTQSLGTSQAQRDIVDEVDGCDWRGPGGAFAHVEHLTSTRSGASRSRFACILRRGPSHASHWSRTRSVAIENLGIDRVHHLPVRGPSPTGALARSGALRLAADRESARAPRSVRSSTTARPLKSTSKSMAAKSGAERPSRNASRCFGR